QRSKESAKHTSIEGITYKCCWFRDWSSYLAGYEFDSYTYDGETFELIVDFRSARKRIWIAD
ncbi:MAG: hypothetical protein ACKPKO_17455, partial [Candidatus Fonsibacter sp.]